MGGNVTMLTLQLENPTVNDEFVEFGTPYFTNLSYSGNFLFSWESLVVDAGSVAVVTLDIQQDDMGMTVEGEDIVIRLPFTLDNQSARVEELSYSAQEYLEIALGTGTSERTDLRPGESHSFLLTLHNRGNGESDIVNFTVDDERGWGHALPPMLLKGKEQVQLEFTITVPQDTENWAQDRIIITPYSDTGEAHPSLELTAVVDPGARALSVTLHEQTMAQDFVNYTLRIRNDGNFPEDIWTRLLIPEGYDYTITPHRLYLPRDSSKYMGLVVKVPGDSLPFANYTLQFYARGGSIPLDEIVLPGLPVSRIEVTGSGSEYSFTAVSAHPGDAEFLWEVNHRSYPLPPGDENSPEITVSFEQAGNYTITLTTTIMDELLQDLRDTSSVTIVVGNQEPDLSAIPGEVTLGVNETLVLDSSMVTDPDSTIVDVMFIYNDTTVHATKLTTSFPEPGEYTITVTVVDNLGATAEKEVLVVVRALEPPKGENDQHIFSHSGTVAVCGIAIVLFIVFGLLMFFERRAETLETETLCQLDEMRILRETRAGKPQVPAERELSVKETRMTDETPEEQEITVEVVVPEVSEEVAAVEIPDSEERSVNQALREPDADGVVVVEEEEDVNGKAPEIPGEKAPEKAAIFAEKAQNHRKKLRKREKRKRGLGKQMSFKERAQMAQKKRK